MNFMFGGFSIIFIFMSLMMFGIIIAVIIIGIMQWDKNNRSPRLTIDATVVAKRMQVSHHHSTDGMDMDSTSYYVTFQVESGDRMELAVKNSEYGMLVEGDIGKLTFQGTRYLSFERV